MADNNKIVSRESDITQLSHHVQQKLCQTRPPYRQGKKLTAVKLRQEIKKLVFPYGIVKKVNVVSNYPSEEFTETYHVHYQDIRSARIAKHFLDGKNFYGGILHVFYAPELESIAETRAKLMQRHKDVSARLKRNKQDLANNRELSQEEQTETSLSYPMNEFSQTNNQANYNEPFYYNDQQLNCEPNAVTERRNIYNTEASTSTTVLQVQSKIVDTGNINDAGHSLAGIKNCDKSKKIKNYKGRSIRNNFKVKVIRPSIVDTSAILKSDIKDKKVSNNVNKTDSNSIVIKKVSDNGAIKKRIIVKNSSIKQLIKPSQDLQNSIQTVKFQIRSVLQKRDDKNHLH